MFWIPALSAVLNALFLMDFVTVAFTGDSVASLIFGLNAENPVTAAVMQHVPGMTPAEFFLANAVVLVFVCAVMTLSIYVAFYSDRRECYRGPSCKVKPDTPAGPKVPAAKPACSVCRRRSP